MTSFEDLLKGPALLAAQQQYKQPTEIQSLTIPLILAGRDVVAMSKTGSGKSAAFLLPLIQLLESHSLIVGCRALILSPNRELALQLNHFTKNYSQFVKLETIVLIGGEPIENQFTSLSKNPDIIIATPGRLLEIFAETQINFNNLKYLVFDEADLLFDKSQNLETSISAILTILPQKRQTILFSATMPSTLSEFTLVHLKNAIQINVDLCELPSTLSLEFFITPKAFKSAFLVHTLFNKTQTLVFVATRYHAEYLSELLNKVGFSSKYIHGNMDQDERNSSLAQFKKNEIDIFIVTDVAARGIDIENLNYVVNYDFPSEIKLFLHRCGRTGRAGRHGTAISILTEDELPYFCGAREKYGSEDWTIKSVQKRVFEDQIMIIDDLLRKDDELKYLKIGMENSEEMYIKSKRKAKSRWVKEAKQMSIGSDSLEDKLLNWKPKHLIKTKNVPNLINHQAKKFLDPPDMKISKFFVGAISDENKEQKSLSDKILDIVPDDQTSLKNVKRKGSRASSAQKERIEKAMRSGSKDAIRAAVSTMSGVQSTGEKYRDWITKNKTHIQMTGEVEVKKKLPKKFEETKQN